MIIIVEMKSLVGIMMFHSISANSGTHAHRQMRGLAGRLFWRLALSALFSTIFFYIQMLGAVLKIMKYFMSEATLLGSFC